MHAHTEDIMSIFKKNCNNLWKLEKDSYPVIWFGC